MTLERDLSGSVMQSVYVNICPNNDEPLDGVLE